MARRLSWCEQRVTRSLPDRSGNPANKDCLQCTCRSVQSPSVRYPMRNNEMLHASLARSFKCIRSIACAIAALLLLATVSLAFDDPVAVSIDGVSISSVPEFIVIASKNPEGDWGDFCGGTDATSISEASFGRKTGVFAASRRSSIYYFAEPSRVKTMLPEFEHEFGHGAIIYGFSSASKQTQKMWIAAGEFNQIGQGLKSGSLYTRSKNRYVWFIDKSGFHVCPMHPLFWGRESRCTICEMPKVALEQIPEQNEPIGASH